MDKLIPPHEVDGNPLDYLQNEIIKAWSNHKARWFARRNKIHDINQYEVVMDWGGELMSDETMKVIDRFPNYESAERRCQTGYDEASAQRVIDLIKNNPDYGIYLAAFGKDVSL